jgi:hypothetical protein
MALAALSACASVEQAHTMGGGTVSDGIPKRAATASEFPAHAATYGYMVIPYFGTGANFNPDPAVSTEEANDLRQFDYGCAKKADSLRGVAMEYLKRGATYGALEGLLGTAGMMWGFGSAISPAAYLKEIGLTGAGGGLAGADQTVDNALSLVHGYCMTMQVYKADELEGKMRGITVIPTYTLNATMPDVVDGTPRNYPNAISHDEIQTLPPTS